MILLPEDARAGRNRRVGWCCSRAGPRPAVRRGLPTGRPPRGRIVLVSPAGLVRPPSAAARVRARLRRLRRPGRRTSHRLREPTARPGPIGAEPRFSMAVAMARTNVLEHRLKALFDETRSHMPLDRRSGRLLAAGIAALVLGLAMVHPGSRPPADGQTRQPSLAEADQPAAEPVRKGTGRIAGRVVRRRRRRRGRGGRGPPPAAAAKGQDFYSASGPFAGHDRCQGGVLVRRAGPRAVSRLGQSRETDLASPAGAGRGGDPSRSQARCARARRSCGSSPGCG